MPNMKGQRRAALAVWPGLRAGSGLAPSRDAFQGWPTMPARRGAGSGPLAWPWPLWWIVPGQGHGRGPPRRLGRLAGLAGRFRPRAWPGCLPGKADDARPPWSRFWPAGLPVAASADRGGEGHGRGPPRRLGALAGLAGRFRCSWPGCLPGLADDALLPWSRFRPAGLAVAASAESQGRGPSRRLGAPGWACGPASPAAPASPRRGRAGLPPKVKAIP